jgi:hypothetical protein
MAANTPRIVYANSTCAIHAFGDVWRLIQNTPWDGDDPLVRDHPDHFVDQPLFLWHTVANPEAPAPEPTPEPKRSYLHRTPREAKVPATPW